ncbi:MAG: hypothetical protein JEY79_11920, partial [Pseudodesulfovibrio sp.]|nr:hypothetical protein [Pseudodesulfovibrio sp.]
GCASIVAAEQSGQGHDSSDVDGHTRANLLCLHHSQRNESGGFSKPDEMIEIEGEPGHDELCQREQEYFLKVIQEDMDITEHMRDAVNSLHIVLAADESIRTRQSVDL